MNGTVYATSFSKQSSRAIILFILLFAFYPSLRAQSDSSTVKPKRLKPLLISGAVVYTGTMAGLYQLWYADYPHSPFHWTNDNQQWMGIDKLGHVTTSYWVGRFGYLALKWAGVKEKHALWYGGSVGLFFLTTVEIFDGFSEEWGASAGDMLANAAGAGIFIGQQLLWHDQRFIIKFSYHPTEYAQYRPDVLGSTTLERFIKDYNGQTYWLSGNIHAFLREGSRFPAWLNVSFGYGAEGMLGGGSNPPEYNGQALPPYNRTAQFFLSLDADLTRIHTRSKMLKGLLTILSFIKIPFPTIEYNAEDNFIFHIMYF